MRAKFSALEQTHDIRRLVKFCLDWFILSPSGGKKNPTFAVFWTSAFSGVASWQQSEKVENRCTTKTSLFIVSTSGAKSHNFGHILTFVGLLY